MGAPRSKEFDDVYFSADDGLAETRHVFLEGNKLAERFADREQDKSDFVVAETGFGTGLNFLAVWKLFAETASPEQKLCFISLEKFPLSRAEIDDALSHWDELSAFRKVFVAAYPDQPQGVFRVEFDGRVTIEVHFGDVNDVMGALDVSVDAWFLDGFRPSSNPDMWEQTVFDNMARLSRSGASFATFTSAGFVRRGLQAAGFDVRKVPGFGRKREMSIGVYR